MIIATPTEVSKPDISKSQETGERKGLSIPDRFKQTRIRFESIAENLRQGFSKLKGESPQIPLEPEQQELDNLSEELAKLNSETSEVLENTGTNNPLTQNQELSGIKSDINPDIPKEQTMTTETKTSNKENTNGISEKLEVITTERTELEKLLEHPKVLNESSYLLLGLTDLDPRKVSERLKNFIRDKRAGQVSSEDAQIIEQVRKEHKERHNAWKIQELQQQHKEFEEAGYLNRESENLDDLYCIHCTNYPLSLDDDKPIIKTTFQGTKGEMLASTVHFSLNHTVGAVAAMGKGFTWEEKDYVIMSPLKSIIDLNGSPYGMLPEDTWWAIGVEKGVKIPQGTKIIAKKGDLKINHLKNIEGIEVVEVDGDPYSQAYKVMEEKGIKTISPDNFKGARKLADQLGAFYGYHLGSASGRKSESYLRAESAIETSSQFGQQKKINKLVKQYNWCKNIKDPNKAEQERAYILVQLACQDYFSQEDFPDIILPTVPETYEPVTFDRVMSAIRTHYAAKSHDSSLQYISKHSTNPQRKAEAEVGLRIFDEFHNKMAKNVKELTLLSKRMLSERIQRVKDYLDIIPPQLIGAFTAVNYPYLP